jgi:HPt (histidine-containing phosphotransfer) domain-containing protein
MGRVTLDSEKQSITGLNREIIAGVLQRHCQTLSDLKSPGFDPHSLWDRVDGDLDLLRDLIVVFAEEFPGMLASMEAAIRNGDAVQLEKSGHKIKGSALQFSCRSAATAAQKLEELGRSRTVAGAEPLLRALRQEIDFLMETLRSMLDRLEKNRAR